MSPPPAGRRCWDPELWSGMRSRESRKCSLRFQGPQLLPASTIPASKQDLPKQQREKTYYFPSQTAYSSLCICDGRLSHHLL